MAYMILSKVKDGYMRVSHLVYSSTDEVNQALSAMVGMAGRTIVVVSFHLANLYEGSLGRQGYIIPFKIFETIYDNSGTKEQKLVTGKPSDEQSKQLTLVD